MDSTNQFHDEHIEDFAPAKKLPDMLNVLTILTFIGCVLGLISAVYGFFATCSQVEKLNEMDISGGNAMAEFMTAAAESAQKQCEQRVPLLVINIIGIVLCLAGALQMRKLKKIGFFVYSAGELLAPIAITLIIGGTFGFMSVVGLLIPVLFVILYATQLKHLK